MQWKNRSQIAEISRSVSLLTMRFHVGSNWDNPGLTISSLAFTGVISSTASGGGGLDPSGARAARVGIRLEW